MHKVVQYRYIILVMLSIGFFSCKYEKIEPATELPKNVSFQNDLIPFFNQSCNSVSCHSAGGIAPDLSPANAYADITTITDMIDLVNPKSSRLYVRMIDTKKPMPLSGVMSYESSQVLSWITDGAKNN